MKTVLIALLMIGGVASADNYAGPPGGYALPPAGVLVPVAPPPMVVQAQPQPRAPLRAAILARFDKNHDGVLEPKERRHAARALRRLARQLAREDGAPRRQRRDFE